MICHGKQPARWQRRKRRKLGRKRERLVKRKQLKVGVQVDVRRAMAGEVRAAGRDERARAPP